MKPASTPNLSRESDCGQSSLRATGAAGEIIGAAVLDGFRQPPNNIIKDRELSDLSTPLARGRHKHCFEHRLCFGSPVILARDDDKPSASSGPPLHGWHR